MATDPMAPLRDALVEMDFCAFPDHVTSALRAAVRAVLPGRQQKKNLEPELQKAVKAFVRTIRRRAR